MRRYGHWAGNLEGSPEDATRCVAEVAYGGRSVRFHQCYRKRGHGPGGLYCKQHGRKKELGETVWEPQP